MRFAHSSSCGHPAYEPDPAVLVLHLHPVTPPFWLPVLEPKDACQPPDFFVIELRVLTT